MAIPNPEDRDNLRFDHISPLQVKDLSSGKIYEARMQNHSNGGIYFESDGIFQKGAKIYICIQNSPYSHSSGVLDYYTGTVIWRKYLKRSFFHYGYGIQFGSGFGKQNMQSNLDRNRKDSRKKTRKPFFRTLRFGTKNKEIFEGKTKNLSASGIFISAEEKLELGQELRLLLPFKGKKVKIAGHIAWLNEEGFGLKFKKIK